MDELEFRRAHYNLLTLIGHAGDPDLGPVNIRNALLTIAAMLDSLSQRITEMQGVEEDE